MSRAPRVKVRRRACTVESAPAVKRAIPSGCSDVGDGIQRGTADDPRLAGVSRFHRVNENPRIPGGGFVAYLQDLTIRRAETARFPSPEGMIADGRTPTIRRSASAHWRKTDRIGSIVSAPAVQDRLRSACSGRRIRYRSRVHSRGCAWVGIVVAVTPHASPVACRSRGRPSSADTCRAPGDLQWRSARDSHRWRRR